LRAIDTIRTRYVSHLGAVATRQGLALQPFLEHAHIPAGLLENPEQIVSMHSLGRFIDALVTETGMFDIGFQAGATPIADHGSVGQRVLEAPTLHEAIRLLANYGRAESSASDFYLTHAPGRAWFCAGPVAGSRWQQQTIELYRLHIMLQLVRAATGPTWMPECVRLRFTDAATAAASPALCAMNLELAAPVTAIAVPIEALVMPLPEPAAAASARQDGPIAPEEFLTLDSLSALRRLLTSYLPYKPSMQMLSDLTGTSKRTLQRFLHARGRTFSQLLDEALFNRSISLLNDPAVSVTEIAYRLGYSEPAHFSRAFRRLTGMSPREYRERIVH
jgi:AraC-like DNA-binding protein